MSETKSLAAPKASFDRRSVVKGAAWSVPVIAAAIAAPAAAASARTAYITFGAVAAKTFSGSPSKSGTGPASFTVNNTPGTTIAGTFVVTITITRVSPAATTPGIGIRKMGQVTSTGAWDSSQVFTASFSQTLNVIGGASQTFDFGTFVHNGQNKDAAGNYSIEVRIPNIPGRTSALTGYSTATLSA